MRFSDFKAQGLKSMPTSPMTRLMEFFSTGNDTNFHPLQGSLYFIYCPLWLYICSCVHMMSILCSAVDTVSSGNSV